VAKWQFPVNGVNHALGTALTDRKNGVPSPLAQAAARAAVNFFAGMDLASAVVITEQEHDNGFTMQDDDQVVFVLPRDSRVTGLPGQSHSPDLLETAKLLMSCTPNGI
jgi:hypothetical protein